MIQAQLKLNLTPRQERQLDHWLRHLASVWNWTIRKIEQDALDGVYWTRYGLQSLLVGHEAKVGIPSHVLRAVAFDGHEAWQRCFKKIAGKPRLKGRGNKLNSIPFPDPFAYPLNGRIKFRGWDRVRLHGQHIPEGRIKCGRIVKRASGWYLCAFIDVAEPSVIPRIASGQIGIDPGFKSLLTLSTGEKITHPRELEASALRLAQSQRGNNRQLTARLHERIANQRKDRNHKLSRRLVSENVFIAFSKDRIKSIARRFGKSVTSSGHYQLRQMLAYKSPASGTRYVEPESPNSTRRCSACGLLTGPRGLSGLSVRQWTCSCGAEHDRDQNSAVNAFIDGLGMSLELSARAA